MRRSTTSMVATGRGRKPHGMVVWCWWLFSVQMSTVRSFGEMGGCASESSHACRGDRVVRVTQEEMATRESTVEVELDAEFREQKIRSKEAGVGFGSLMLVDVVVDG